MEPSDPVWVHGADVWKTHLEMLSGEIEEIRQEELIDIENKMIDSALVSIASLVSHLERSVDSSVHSVE